MRQVLVVVVFLVAATGAAFAGDSEKAREHYVKGTRAFELGLYDEAIAEYMAAYKLKDDPAFLFNLGQAHRLAKHPAEALRFYKTYLAKIPAAANRAEVEAKMAEMRRLLEQAKQPEPEPMPETPAEAPPEPGPQVKAPPSGAPEAPAPIATPLPIATTEATPVEPSRSGRGLRLAGVASAAGGLALVGTGVIFAVLAKQAADDLSELDKNRGVFDPSKESAGERDQLLAGVFLGVGAAAIATGAVLYVLGLQDDSGAAQSFVVAPSIAAHTAGATLHMVF